MRYKELLEYKRDITANNLGEKFLSRLENDNSVDSDYDLDLSDESELQEFISRKLEQVEKADPTPNKQYTEWLVRRYIDGSISRFEDALSTWADFLHEYHTLKIHRQLPQQIADINRFKGRDSALRLMLRINTLYDEFQTARNEKEVMPKGDAKEILNNSEVRIIIPNDEASACYYGQGTQWCTAAKNNNMFDEYHSDDSPLFILIPKEPTHPGEKYQIHIASESVDVMDETDSPLQLSSIINRFLHTDLEKVFTAHSVHASELIEFTPYESLVYGVKELQKIINQHKAYIINSENDLNGFDYPGASKKAIDDIIQTSPSDITDSVLLFMKSNSVGNGLPYEQGGFNMMMHEIKDGMAGWLRDEYVESEALHDFLYEHPTVSKLFRQIATKMTNN